MPLLPNNANIFGDLMRRPDIAANWFQGAMSPNASSAGTGGLGDLRGASAGQADEFLLGTEATGQPVTSLPREGLFPKLLSTIGLISPDVHPDVRTQFAEQILLKHMKEQEAEQRSNVIDHAYNIVKEIGGDKFAALGPSLFKGIIDDPQVFAAFKGVPSYADMMDKKMQEAIQIQSAHDDERYQASQDRNQAMMQDIQLRDTDRMAQIEAQVGAQGNRAEGSQQDKDLSLLNHIFNGGLITDKEGFTRAVNDYLATGDVKHAVQAGQQRSIAPSSPGFWGGLGNLLGGGSTPAADPEKKKKAMQALGIGG